MPGTHAILSPSSSERWINCPPSAMENAAQTDTGSSYAQQGTDAHALCEYKVKKALGYKGVIPPMIWNTSTKRWRNAPMPTVNSSWNRWRRQSRPVPIRR